MRKSTIALFLIAVVAVAVALVLLPSTGGDDQPQGTVSTSTVTPTDASTATSDATTISSPGLILPDNVEVCDLYGTLTVAGTVESTDLVEASGLAVSRTTPNVLWSHNDSRDGARLYAFRPDGTDLGVFEVPNGLALDWEDMAAGPDAQGEGSYLYAGDIGDNFLIRDGIIALFRVDDVDPTTLDGSFPTSDPIALRFPDGPADAEAMFIDPIDPAVYVVTKADDVAAVYRGPIRIGDGLNDMTLVAEIPLGAQVSGADISADGSVIAFRGYRTVWMWNRLPGETVAEALSGPHCDAASPDEIQGESIALDATYSYFTVSEGPQPPIYEVPFER
jgi:hypothetical protein